MMFETLSEKLNLSLSKLTRKGKISQKDLDLSLRDVRMSLLEADVDYKVTKQFIGNLKNKLDRSDIFSSLTPGQSVIKYVQDELIEILGTNSSDINKSKIRPSTILLVGLQGTGKTTTAAKLALYLRNQKNSVLLSACDLQRPGAIEQLNQLGKELNIPVFSQDKNKTSPLKIAKDSKDYAIKENYDFLILDTAGRISIDEILMDELVKIKEIVDPSEILLVLDSMTGQDAVNSGSVFNDLLGVTGVILTKMDGDARGGAALSMKNKTGLPIKFIGLGEKSHQFEQFYPDRMASRILGMGDIQTLIEKAESSYDAENLEILENKLKKDEFDLNDLLEQFKTLKKMGSMSDIVGMIPGLNNLRGKIKNSELNDDKLKYTEAIILSMTPSERKNPSIINGSRRKRIANGSGTSPSEINQLLNQFKQMQKMMRRLSKGKSQRSLMEMFNRK
ncbi:MAG: signal recognition particle protein [Chloroflexi bacterium]|nr:signal recognition particle protein [Chloroflexota bacterium]